VQLLDVDGKLIVGANVTFTVTGGGGSVTGGVATTGSNGVAMLGAWSVGNGTNQLTASIPAPDQVGWHLVGEALGTLTGPLGFSVDAVYGQMGHKSGVAGKTTLAGGTANAGIWVGRATGRVHLLLLGGVGAFRVNVDVPGFGSTAATKLALDGGGGLLIGSSRRRGFLTVQYVTVRTAPQTTAFIPISAGVVIPL